MKYKNIRLFIFFLILALGTLKFNIYNKIKEGVKNI